MENTQQNQTQEIAQEQIHEGNPVGAVLPEGCADKEFFNPAEFLTTELAKAGFETPDAWASALDPKAFDSELKDEERIFFVNRSLRLYMSEQENRNHMEARMLLADGLSANEWKAIVVKGVVPWILNKLPVSKNQLQEAAAAVSEHTEQKVQANEPGSEMAEASA